MLHFYLVSSIRYYSIMHFINDLVFNFSKREVWVTEIIFIQSFNFLFAFLRIYLWVKNYHFSFPFLFYCWNNCRNFKVQRFLILIDFSFWDLSTVFSFRSDHTLSWGRVRDYTYLNACKIQYCQHLPPLLRIYQLDGFQYRLLQFLNDFKILFR